MRFSNFSFDVFTIPTTCVDECGQSGGLNEACTDRCGIPNGSNNCIGCAGHRNSSRHICTKWNMNFNTGKLNALYYGRDAFLKNYSLVTPDTLNACEFKLGNFTLGNNTSHATSVLQTSKPFVTS